MLLSSSLKSSSSIIIITIIGPLIDKRRMHIKAFRKSLAFNDVHFKLLIVINFLFLTGRLFGIPGVCSACNKQIAAFEFVMRAGKNAYHIECFSCQICRQRFRVGENFHFYNNKVLCWDHYRTEKEGDKTKDEFTDVGPN